MITVTEIPDEPTRFYATSRSRPGLLHIVDMSYSDDGERPRPVCSCEGIFARNNTWCPHLQAVVDFLCARRPQAAEQWLPSASDQEDRGQDIKDGLREPERNEDDPKEDR